MSRVDPVERVLNLLTLLHESAVPLSRAEIAARMARGSTPYPDDDDAQRQSFTTDRRTLADLGILIRQRVRSGRDAGQTEYWIDRRDLHLPDLRLDDDERLVLATALATLSRSLPVAGEALLKLGPGWSGESPLDFGVDVPDLVIDTMAHAREGHVLELAVARGRFEFEPWAVVLDGGSWFAVGHDAERGAARAVRLDRLTSDPEMVDRPRTAAPARLDQTMITSLIRAADTTPTVAHVLVDELAAARAALSARVRERSQVDLFGGVSLHVVVDDVARFRSWLIELGDRAELIDPPALRDDYVAWLRSVAEHEPSGVTPPPRPTAPGRRPGPEAATARLQRLLSIVPWLYRRGSARIDEIAARVGASPEQVLRDLIVATMCGVPPYTPDALFGFWVDAEQRVVNVISPTLLTDEIRLTPRQAAAVAVALSALEAVPGGDDEVITRLRAKLVDALGDFPVHVELDEPPYLDEVRAAVERHERLRIEYVDLNDRMTERLVDPQKLFIDRGAAYIVADDHLRGEERVFRVDRLVSAAPTGEHFPPRPVTLPAGRTWTWMVPDREVVVRLPPGSEWVLDRYATLAHATGDGGWLTVWLSVVSENWLATLLLRCGPGAEVLAPEELADLPRRRAEAALSRYR